MKTNNFKKVLGYALVVLFLFLVGFYSEDNLLANVVLIIVKIGVGVGIYVCIGDELGKTTESC